MNREWAKSGYGRPSTVITVIGILVAWALSATLAVASSIDENLMHAAKHNDLETLNELIKKGANVNATDDFLSSPLIFASQMGNVECATALIEAGADVNAACFLEGTPLIWAADKGHVEIVKLLITNGAAVEAADYAGWTALMKAIFRRNTEIVKVLLDSGANVNAKNSAGYSVLFIGETLKTPPEIMTMLAKAGAKKPEQICCTWINTKYGAEKAQKISFHYDGTFATFIKSPDDPFARGTFQIVDKSSDSEGNTIYKIKMHDPIRGKQYKLARVSKDGKRLEFVCDPDQFPGEINANLSGYCHYLRASVN